MLYVFMMLLVSITTFSVERIVAEYPSLRDFFTQPEVVSIFNNYPLELRDMSPQVKSHIAALEMEANLDNFSLILKKKIVFNSYYINKEIFSAQEFKFILCHELGHLNDPNLLSRSIGAELAFGATVIGTSVLLIKSLIQLNMKLCLRSLKIGAAVVSSCCLARAYLHRKGEYCADEYALKMTKDHYAATAALTKRKQLVKSYRNLPVIGTLLNLLDDHPSEENRIDYLNHIK